MSPNLTLVVVIGVLFAAGTYLVLERSLTRVLVGVALLSNGANLLILVAGGAAGGPPLIGVTAEGEMSDPLPQALVLTAIVITLGLTAFLLAMAYRSWQLHRHDEVQDDVEDRRIARLAARDERAFEDTDTEGDGETLAEEAAIARDETDRGGPGSGAVDHGPAQDDEDSTAGVTR
ncbi:Na(+)/H(+) antiporter subunit C [Cellulomonas sp. JZ18]|uniref:Na(+)/H(+) antiporter subunit C n=1 Tax=Cellulomonas sp. JZ18 TaxID=2654191 RepID=UPI0012D3BABD|nr:Na(+)/H(+) antiporter subunit C [Cellulomonas sp. JZ18]QGQ21164.1 Na(+)/H(+) antiporter subunit C [Cellulomonas sp. JZ18]